MTDKYSKLTPSMILNLAAPHTWAASIIPVLLAICVAVSLGYKVSLTLSITLLCIAVLLQSAVNAINDYFDFVKGTDTTSDNLEASDSVLVFNDVNPKSVLYTAIMFVIIALLLGIYCIYSSGFFCLIIACIGICAVALYSGGKLPISYLPIGEVISGFVMGGLITYACFNVLTLDASPWILVVSIPVMLDIALIMLTNNTSDIEKDVSANRKTLPTLLGREKSRVLYRTLILLVYVSVFLICLVWFTNSLLLYPFLLLLSLPIATRLMKSSLSPECRIASMGQICNFNIAIGAMYCLMILGSNFTLVS